MDKLIAISPGDHRRGRDLQIAGEALYRGGVRQLIVREPQLPERRLVQLLRALAQRVPTLILHASNQNALELIGGGALGLHLTGGSNVTAIRAGFRGLLGYSAHSVDDARYAQDAGADYVLLSPVFTPTSKPNDGRPTLGVEGVAAAQRALDIPVFALGGVTPSRAADCRAAGVHGVAVLGGLFGWNAPPEQLEQAARSYRAALEGAG